MDSNAVVQQERAMTIFMSHYFANSRTWKAEKAYSTWTT